MKKVLRTKHQVLILAITAVFVSALIIWLHTAKASTKAHINVQAGFSAVIKPVQSSAASVIKLNGGAANGQSSETPMPSTTAVQTTVQSGGTQQVQASSIPATTAPAAPVAPAQPPTLQPTPSQPVQADPPVTSPKTPTPPPGYCGTCGNVTHASGIMCPMSMSHEMPTICYD